MTALRVRGRGLLQTRIDANWILSQIHRAQHCHRRENGKSLKRRKKEPVVTKAAPPAKKPKHSNSQDLTPLSYNPKHIIAGPSSPRRAVPHNQPPPVPMRAPPVNDDTHFFDRVKRALDNGDIYNEFLKRFLGGTRGKKRNTSWQNNNRRAIGRNLLLPVFNNDLDALTWARSMEAIARFLKKKRTCHAQVAMICAVRF